MVGVEMKGGGRRGAGGGVECGAAVLVVVDITMMVVVDGGLMLVVCSLSGGEDEQKQKKNVEVWMISYPPGKMYVYWCVACCSSEAELLRGLTSAKNRSLPV